MNRQILHALADRMYQLAKDAEDWHGYTASKAYRECASMVLALEVEQMNKPHESRSPDGDGQTPRKALIQAQALKPYPIGEGPEADSSTSVETSSGVVTAPQGDGRLHGSSARKSAAGSEPADSHTPHADAIMRAALFRLTTFPHTHLTLRECGALTDAAQRVENSKQFCVPCIAQRALDAEATARKEPMTNLPEKSAAALERGGEEWPNGPFCSGCGMGPVACHTYQLAGKVCCPDCTHGKGEPADARTPSEPQPCKRCEGRGWIMGWTHQELGGGLSAGGAWNERCPDCKPKADSAPSEP